MRSAFEFLFDEISYPMWISSADGKILRVNPAACRFLGAEPEKLIGSAASLIKTPYKIETREVILDGEKVRLSMFRHEKRLLSKASHDLRNPLSVILANSYLLKESSDTSTKMKRQIDAIRRSAESMDELIETFSEL